jgi:hypothetical protein
MAAAVAVAVAASTAAAEAVGFMAGEVDSPVAVVDSMPQLAAFTSVGSRVLGFTALRLAIGRARRALPLTPRVMLRPTAA